MPSTILVIPTPLHYATAHEQPQAISMLVQAGANNLESTDSKDNTPLHYAAGYGRVNERRLLLNLGASPAAKNGTGETPLDVARWAAPPLCRALR